MEVKTDRLKLVPLGIKYLNTVHKYASDKDITKYMFFHSDNIESTTAFLIGVELAWKKDPIDYYEFAIIYEGHHVGAISLSIEHNIGELGWILDKAYWGKGIITEAAKAIVEFSKSLSLSKLIANCDKRNIASYKVMEKIGMKRISDSGKRKNYHDTEESIELLYERIL